MLAMAERLKFDPVINSRNGDGAALAAPCMSGLTESAALNRRYVDITAMIRSLQRTEGMTDCFRRGLANCDQLVCAWRRYCLGQSDELLMNTDA
jgi:hypothetical protein